MNGAIILRTLVTLSLLTGCASMALAGPAQDRIAERGLAFTAAAFVGRAGAGDLDSVRLFLAAGMDPNVPDQGTDDGISALFAAAVKGHAAVVDALLAGGAAVDSAGPSGSTGLMGAALGGHGELVATLLRRGAAVDARNYQDQTALTLAAIGGHAVIVRMLVARGAQVNATAAYGQTPLIFAATAGNADAVRILIEHGALVNVRDSMTGSTALDRATQAEVVALLRAAGARKSSELK